MEEYRSFMLDAWPRVQGARTAREQVEITTEYARHLPVHVVAVCPYCGNAVAEPVDTYSLNGFGWERPGIGLGWSATLGERIPLAAHCPHVRIIAFFLNLEGKTPDDLFPDKVIHSGPEVPSIMLVPMRAPDGVAVMHMLPVSRFDTLQTVHHYSVHFVTYFTKSSATFDAATRDWGVHYGLVEYQDVSYDLETWVSSGRLGWLNASPSLGAGGTALALADPASDHFPYANILGDRSPERIITRDGARHPPRSLVEKLLGALTRPRGG